MNVAIIAAVAANGVIGDEGEIPWHIPEDMARFKETTMGHPVVLGHNTYENIVDRIGGPLPGRTTIVLSTGEPTLPEEVVHAESVDGAVAAARETDAETAYVAGGAAVYEQFLPLADRLLLTEIEAPHVGDTYFPERDRTAWEEQTREERNGYAFVEYRRTD